MTTTTLTFIRVIFGPEPKSRKLPCLSHLTPKLNAHTGQPQDCTQPVVADLTEPAAGLARLIPVPAQPVLLTEPAAGLARLLPVPG